ncbi:N-acetyltransferase [Paraburkholderia sp. DHOC27]|uniref:GNAT family N-acetyltransferase n=1 Tax=Paraburkholderia sp. DHOC27 TaxID=2303330 RepID=UPI000E3DDFC8|nr:GNAT family N-acetyltransferase [Paraburkholderia sp. DHOC27]RFU48403.1 N-acetyltransferase [Paraburkholderia sp. DHOC27]
MTKPSLRKGTLHDWDFLSAVHEACMREYGVPSHQRLGIGTALLKRLIAQAHADRKPIRLRVLRVNPARQLYERNGFTIDRSTEERHFMSYTASVADAADQHQ